MSYGKKWQNINMGNPLNALGIPDTFGIFLA